MTSKTLWKNNAVIFKINDFRTKKAQNKGNYKKFRAECLDKELREIYANEINSERTRTRETNDNSVIKFLKTKKNLIIT